MKAVYHNSHVLKLFKLAVLSDQQYKKQKYLVSYHTRQRKVENIPI